MAISDPLDWSLTTGLLPAALFALGGFAAGYLLRGRWTVWWLRVTGCLLLASAILTVGLVWFVNGVWQPFPDRLPITVCEWTCVAIAAVLLAAGNAYRQPWRRALTSGVAAVLVIVGCAVGVNAYYGQHPTVRSVLGRPPRNQVSFAQATTRTSSAGRVASVHIPGTTSGFRARAGLVYVPPAYRPNDRRPLPVLVLLAGQPGNPQDLFAGGRMAEVLDGYAGRHGGRAPVVVVPDDLGTTMANPLCLDSRLGRVATYLARDVPDWIRRNLTVDPDPAHWAIGGYSHGGTCALQLAVGYPTVYPTFVDVSGQREPTLGSRDKTVRAAFGGDANAFRRVNPLDVLRHKRFPQVFGVLVAGTEDGDYAPQQREVRAACASAGMTVEWVELPGGHNWAVWAPGLATGLDRITGRLGLEQL
jgi:S-formylglutathione hydrolase FrmB